MYFVARSPLIGIPVLQSFASATETASASTVARHRPASTGKFSR
jgi:hypothetical protein